MGNTVINIAGLDDRIREFVISFEYKHGEVISEDGVVTVTDCPLSDLLFYLRCKEYLG